jgi:hypothetical protein
LSVRRGADAKARPNGRRQRSGMLGLRRRSRRRRIKKERGMNLVVWLPAMFALGLVSMGVCYAFVFACEDI